MKRILILSLFCLLECSYGFARPEECFDAIRDHVLLGAAFAAPPVTSLADCLEKCLNRKRCRSVVFYSKRVLCVLNSHTKDEKRSGYAKAKKTDWDAGEYYERNCFDKPSMAIRQRDARNPIKDCFEVIKGKVLIGIVDKQLQDIGSMKKCAKTCDEARKKLGYVCKAAMYYPKEKECLIATQNRKDMPELFTDDVNSIYIENKCFDNDKHEIASGGMTTGQSEDGNSDEMVTAASKTTSSNEDDSPSTLSIPSNQPTAAAQTSSGPSDSTSQSHAPSNSPINMMGDAQSHQTSSNTPSKVPVTPPATLFGDKDKEDELEAGGGGGGEEDFAFSTDPQSIMDPDEDEDTTTTTTTTTTHAPTTAAKPKLPDHMILPPLIQPGDKNVPSPVEDSGYEVAPKYAVTSSLGTQNSSEMIPPAVIDTYNNQLKQAPVKSPKSFAKKQKEKTSSTSTQPTTAELTDKAVEKQPSLGKEIEEDIGKGGGGGGYDGGARARRKLRNPNIKDCFTEVEASSPKEMNGRVMKAYSLEQCVDICRLCKKCIKRQMCRTVAYDAKHQLCALSASPAKIMLPSSPSTTLFFARGDC